MQIKFWRGIPYYWRMAWFYLFYFSVLGALIPYWSLYLESIGFRPAQIGELMAILVATRIIAPNLWAWLADRWGCHMALARVTSLLALLSFGGVFFGNGYWWLALVMSIFSFFWNAALPQFEATALAHLGERSHRYSQVRLWGSIGFIFAVAGLGKLFELLPVSLLPPILMLLFGGIWLASLSVPEHSGHDTPHEHGKLWAVLRRPEVLALLAVTFMMQASHGAYYTFYTLYLEKFGYSRGLIGQLWALGVIAEIGVFLVMHRLLRRFSVRDLLALSLALAALRWLLISQFPHSLPLLAAAQTLHAASFAIHHASAMQWIHARFPGRLSGRGQAIYTSVAFGGGGAFGALMAGYAWEHLGPSQMFLLSVVFCLIGLFATWRWIGRGE
jgi:PPP family 3-phenylpropionic acid transporter